MIRTLAITIEHRLIQNVPMEQLTEKRLVWGYLTGSAETEGSNPLFFG